MSLEWQNPKTEIPKPAKEAECFGAEQSVEQELSPEKIALIMAKVQDINTPGVAFKVAHIAIANSASNNECFGDIKNILRYGFLGCLDAQSKEIVHDYKQALKNKTSRVYFNIVGRSLEKIENQSYFWKFLNESSLSQIGIVFDLSGFKETLPRTRRSNETFANKTYRPDSNNNFLNKYFDKSAIDTIENNTISEKNSTEITGEVLKILGIDHNTSVAVFIEKAINNKQQLIDFGMSEQNFIQMLEDAENNGNFASTDSEDGFLASFRVPPRNFKGLVVELRYEEQKARADNDILLLKNEMLELDKQGKDNLLPIYDLNGNLLWPIKMSSDEVVKFVAERDAKSANKEEK